jgi:hypothetical protein
MKMNVDTIVGYVFKAETFCTEHMKLEVHRRLVKPLDIYDNETNKLDAELYLDAIANKLGINRVEESSFDSDDFPKIIFHSDEWDGDCEGCNAWKRARGYSFCNVQSSIVGG